MIKLEKLSGVTYLPAQYLEHDEPAVRKNEILRYSGIKPGPVEMRGHRDTDADGNATGADADLSDDDVTRGDVYTLCDEVIAQAKSAFTYRVAFLQISLKADDIPVLDIFKKSQNLMKNLEGCDEAVVFAATVGAGIDHLIRRYERIEPARSLMLQAHGAERVEALCDAFNDDIKKAAAEVGLKAHPRFSPGYGDLSLDVQPMILSMLNAEKRLGITLGKTFMMSPSKSVTAIIGLEKHI